MLSDRQAKRWAALCAVLLVVALVVIAIARRSASVVARYTSDGRPDGGYTLTLDAAGKCEITANRGGPEFESQGRYQIEDNQCLLETRPRPQSPLAALLGFRSKMFSCHQLDRAHKWSRVSGERSPVCAVCRDRKHEPAP